MHEEEQQFGPLGVPQGEAGQTSLGEKDKPKSPDDLPETDELMAKRAAVKTWQQNIKKAKSKFSKDFDRMRDNMDFVANIQWQGQTGVKCDKYIVNMTLQAINRGVAALYARNP